MMQVKVCKKDLPGQHPMITCHIFLRSMKEKFHCRTEIKKIRAWFTDSTNPKCTADSASSVPAYSAAEFSHVRNFKKHEP